MEDIRVAEIQANTRISEARQNSHVAEAYLAAMRNRNVTALSNILHPQFNYVAPTGETHGRESFLATMQTVFNHVQKIDLQAQYASGDQTAHIYNMFFAPSANPVSTINVLTHEDGQIKKIQAIDDTKFLPEHFRPENNNPSSNTRTA
jgi:hypothetical protein